MKIALGNDHAGFPLRPALLEAVTALGHEVVDFGTATGEACDYPDVVVPLTAAVVAGECDLGILICGTGIGMSIAANKVAGIYAAHCTECFSAALARLHNAANVITLGGRVLGPGLAAEIVRVFLTTDPLAEERHTRRQQKVRRLEA